MKAFQSIGALAETLLSMAESRFELFSLEFRLERARIAAVLMLVVLGSGSLLLAGVAFTAGLIWAVAPEHRLLALGICMAVYLLVSLLCLLGIVRFFRRSELPFSETRRELKEDAQCLMSAIRNNESAN